MIPRNEATTIPAIAGVPSLAFCVDEDASKVGSETALVVTLEDDDRLCAGSKLEPDSTLPVGKIADRRGLDVGLITVDSSAPEIVGDEMSGEGEGVPCVTALVDGGFTVKMDVETRVVARSVVGVDAGVVSSGTSTRR